ncbi:MAG TPA: hypothetical protein VKA95_15310 [Nitrososphaeraceae archaeon]|nr:hypothetical protein [Nitrososphaeraceae archaeon]
MMSDSLLPVILSSPNDPVIVNELCSVLFSLARRISSDLFIESPALVEDGCCNSCCC